MKKKKLLTTLAIAGMCTLAPFMLSGCANGVDGKNGANGLNGKSAYEIAVENGFEGTELEWLESLKGEKESFTVSFDYNLGKFLPAYNSINGYRTNSVEVEQGDWVTLPNVETEYEELAKYFKGWHTGTSVYDARFTNYTPVNSDLILYAMWDEELLEKDLYATEGLEIRFDSTFHRSEVVSYTGTETSVTIPRLIKTNLKFEEVTYIALDSNPATQIKELVLSEDNYIRYFNGQYFGDLETISGNLNNLTYLTP